MPEEVAVVREAVRRERETFFCPLCQEEHDKETEHDTLHVCRQCKSLIETWLIGMNVFKNHGREFVLQWKERAEILREYQELKKKYSSLIGYLKNRNIAIPKELAA